MASRYETRVKKLEEKIIKPKIQYGGLLDFYKDVNCGGCPEYDKFFKVKQDGK